MTLKQKLFVKKYIQNGGNGTKAAFHTYNVKNVAVACSMASENLRKPLIREAIEEALRLQGLTADQLARNLEVLANAQVSKVSADVKLRANIEVLKLTGQYPTQKHANINFSVKANLSHMRIEDLQKEGERIDGDLHELAGGGTTPKPV